jgi:iron(III) transport system ATP-binding protein
MMKQDYLVLKNLVKIFGSGHHEVKAVDEVNLEVKQGELVTLLGPSGCGKTTTLRMISGFEIPTTGKILIDDEDISKVPPNKRPTTLVFQNYALFPHMTVFENITYGLRIRKQSAADIDANAEEVMRLVGLKGMRDRAPAQLSGGQQQRVSLARSLIMEPKVLLLDEPLSNLDAKLRVSTRIEIRKLQQRLGITSVYVTHDQEEAMTLSDRVVIMHQGKIQQVGDPKAIYAHPVNRFVAGFIGKANFLEARVTDRSDTLFTLDLFGRTVHAPRIPTSIVSSGDNVILVVRPESIDLEPKRADTLTGTIRQSVYLGSEMIYEVDIQNNIVTAEIANPQDHTIFPEGTEVSIKLKEKSLHILPYEDAAAE